MLRNDSPMRNYEGLPIEKQVVLGSADAPVEIEQDGLRFLVDVLDGQKTGFFLDQRENRLAHARLAKGSRCARLLLLHRRMVGLRAVAGARSVSGIDSSEARARLAERNVALNRGRGHDAVHQRRHVQAAGRSSVVGRRGSGSSSSTRRRFAKSRKKIREALKAYRALNRLAMSVTDPGGHLVTCTCSHLVEQEAFMNIARRRRA